VHAAITSDTDITSSNLFIGTPLRPDYDLGEDAYSTAHVGESVFSAHSAEIPGGISASPILHMTLVLRRSFTKSAAALRMNLIFAARGRNHVAVVPSRRQEHAWQPRENLSV
jgi:hypothetical protein